MIEGKKFLGFISLPEGRYCGVWEDIEDGERHSEAVIGLAVVEESLLDEGEAWARTDLIPVLYSSSYGFQFGIHITDEVRFIGCYDTQDEEEEARMLTNYVKTTRERAKSRLGDFGRGDD